MILKLSSEVAECQNWNSKLLCLCLSHILKGRGQNLWFHINKEMWQTWKWINACFISKKREDHKLLLTITFAVPLSTKFYYLYLLGNWNLLCSYCEWPLFLELEEINNDKSISDCIVCFAQSRVDRLRLNLESATCLPSCRRELKQQNCLSLTLVLCLCFSTHTIEFMEFNMWAGITLLHQLIVFLPDQSKLQFHH